MPITVEQITPAQRDIILSKEEDHFFDIKSLDIRPADLAHDISSLANSDGGDLYIGIDEVGPHKRRIWRGFANQEAANAHLQVFENLFPLGRDFQYTFLRCAGEPGLILQVQIHKTKDIKKATNGIPYMMQKLGLKEPRIVENENSLLVLIRHEPLASSEQAILAHLDAHPSIKNSEARKICHVSADYNMKAIFQRLVEHGIIEKVPGTRTGGTRYRKVPNKAARPGTTVGRR